MKKLLFAIAICGFVFTSCGNKTKTASDDKACCSKEKTEATTEVKAACAKDSSKCCTAEEKAACTKDTTVAEAVTATEEVVKEVVAKEAK